MANSVVGLSNFIWDFVASYSLNPLLVISDAVFFTFFFSGIATVVLAAGVLLDTKVGPFVVENIVCG